MRPNLSSLLCRARFVGAQILRAARDRKLAGETWHADAWRLDGCTDDTLLRILKDIHDSGQIHGPLAPKLAAVVAEWGLYREAVAS